MDMFSVHKLGPKLIEALDAPMHCIWLELRVAFNEMPTVKCEYYPVGDDGTIDFAAATLAEYELVPRKVATTLPHRAEAMGFDAWMRQRTEQAHAEFMARRLPV